MTVEGTHLGKQSSYPQHYDKSVLVAVPRKLNRQQYSIDANHLPFQGVDVWHAYEFSFLLESGLPVAGILKLVYSCTNEFLVESKSLKLYLNSFNMDRFGRSREEGIIATTSTISKDLTELLGTLVQVHFIDHTTESSTNDFTEYQLLEDLVDENQLHCSDFKENPDLLTPSEHGGNIKVGSHLLRSNCKITYQPDWGSIYLYMKGEQLPATENLLRYLVSLRNENHFHEEICEMVFKRLVDKFAPEEITVSCLYTRRGGIDINPVRSSNGKNIPYNLTNPTCKAFPEFRQ